MINPVDSFLKFLSCAASFFLLVCSIATAHAETYTVGIVPQQAASALARNWTPLLSYIERKTGLPLRFKTAPTIPEFERRLAQGEYDFAYMNPYHYGLLFSQKPGYLALAKEKDTRLQGLIVVAKNSDIKSIKQLAGKDIAFPSPLAFAASVLPRLQLKQQGVPFTPYFVTSHDSVYHAVARGIYPAGGGVVRTLDSAPADIRDKLRILWKTEPYTPHALAAHPRVPQTARQAFSEALFAMDKDPEASDILRHLNMRGWEPGRDKDWDDVRKLPFDTDEVPIIEK